MAVVESGGVPIDIEKERIAVLNAPPVEVMAERIDAILAHDRYDQLAGIATPTLVTAALDDACTPPYFSRQLAERIPGAELHLFEDGGHFVHIYRADEFNRRIGGFLARHDG